jgi:ribosome-binding protein aMBF1 (putative translation factor)
MSIREVFARNLRKARHSKGLSQEGLANRFVEAGLIVATILVAAAVGVDLLAPLLLNS